MKDESKITQIIKLYWYKWIEDNLRIDIFDKKIEFKFLET